MDPIILIMHHVCASSPVHSMTKSLFIQHVRLVGETNSPYKTLEPLESVMLSVCNNEFPPSLALIQEWQKLNIQGCLLFPDNYLKIILILPFQHTWLASLSTSNRLLSVMQCSVRKRMMQHGPAFWHLNKA